MTDWLARKVRGVIDFRLPGDPSDLPSAVLKARTLEYLAQAGRCEVPAKTPDPVPEHAKTSHKRPRKAPDDAPEQGDWWRDG